MATESDPVVDALRIAAACSISLVVANWWNLAHANLAVWSSYMVMALVPLTVFQRGFERIVGRGFGILAAVFLVGVFPDEALIRFVLGCSLLLVIFYGFLAGRLNYAFLNGGLYFAVLFQVAHAQPATVITEAWEMFLAVLVGISISDLVVWITARESSLTINPGMQPLFPIRNDILNRASMMVVTIVLSIRVCDFFDLPLYSTIVSVMIITGAPDLHSMMLKGEMRLEGLLAGGLYGALAFFLLSLVPHFSILVVLIFLGTFVAGYLAKTLGEYAYFGAQLGLVICLIVVVPAHEFGSLQSAYQRGAGILIAMAMVLIVPGLWPGVATSALKDNTATPKTDAKPA